jgi:hypothetical protein
MTVGQLQSLMMRLSRSDIQDGQLNKFKKKTGLYNKDTSLYTNVIQPIEKNNSQKEQKAHCAK